MVYLEAQVTTRNNIGLEYSNNRLSLFSHTTVKLDIPHFVGSKPLG